MRLFDGGRAPNPRRVRIFLAEKGLPLPEVVPVDLARLEHLSAEMTARNPWQRVPVLELDDGTVISESVAICRYFEELHPEPPLFGVGPTGRAVVEMWNRRLELGLLGAVAAAFRHLHPAMAAVEVPQVAAWGEANKARVEIELRRLDAALADRRFVGGAAFTLADITGAIAVDFMKAARLAVPADCREVLRWHGEVTARPSWSA